MAQIKMNDAIEQCIDQRDPILAGVVADALRKAGFTYMQVLQRVQARRPDVTAADWDDLMAECEDVEARS